VANLIADLRTALRDALRADATIAALLGNSAGTVHVEAADQPDEFLTGAAGRCFVRAAGIEVQDRRDASALLRVTFSVLFDLVDVRGSADALPNVQQGLANVLRDSGANVFDVYFTDNGGNRLGKSGEWTLQDVGIEALDGLQDRDRPVVLATVAVTLWVTWPLT
jgi:hypothetical protein